MRTPAYNATDFNFKASYIQQYSLNIEKELKGNLLTLAYVGNHGSRLATYLNINQLPYLALPVISHFAVYHHRVNS